MGETQFFLPGFPVLVRRASAGCVFAELASEAAVAGAVRGGALLDGLPGMLFDALRPPEVSFEELSWTERLRKRLFEDESAPRIVTAGVRRALSFPPGGLLSKETPGRRAVLWCPFPCAGFGASSDAAAERLRLGMSQRLGLGPESLLVVPAGRFLGAAPAEAVLEAAAGFPDAPAAGEEGVVRMPLETAGGSFLFEGGGVSADSGTAALWAATDAAAAPDVLRSWLPQIRLAALAPLSDTGTPADSVLLFATGQNRSAAPLVSPSDPRAGALLAGFRAVLEKVVLRRLAALGRERRLQLEGAASCAEAERVASVLVPMLFARRETPAPLLDVVFSALSRAGVFSAAEISSGSETVWRSGAPCRPGVLSMPVRAVESLRVALGSGTVGATLAW